MAKQVLIVDDDPNTVHFLSVAIEDAGYEVVTAADGVEGYARLEREVPDLLLLDVMMPRQTGFGLFQKIKGDERFVDLKVMMITGVEAHLYSLDRDEAGAEEGEFPGLGTADELRWKIVEMRESGEVRPEYFLEKPIVPEYAVEKVRALIGEP